MPTKEKLLLIDANALIHRAYHALPKLTDPKGRLVNAVYGFSSVLLKVLRELRPEYVVCAFDFPAPTFRHKEFKAYKAQRPKTPQDLVSQVPIVKEVVKAFDIPIIEKKGFEADDVIGTIVSRARQHSVRSATSRPFGARATQPAPVASLTDADSPLIEIIILTGDLDALQLVDKRTKVYAPKRGIKQGIVYDQEGVEEKYGIKPEQLTDFKGLVGDPSDNIPGVAGIGPKRASELLKKYGCLEKMVEVLGKHYQEALFSKMLATIKKDVPMNFDLEKSKVSTYSQKKVIDLFNRLGFRSLIERLLQERQNKLF